MNTDYPVPRRQAHVDDVAESWEPLSDELVGAIERAQEYARASLAHNTRTAYANDWADFVAFCARHDLDPLPATPGTLTRYIIALAGVVKTSTIERRLSAIRYKHADAKAPDATNDRTFKRILAGIRNTHGSPPSAKQEIRERELLRLLRAIERQPKPHDDPFVLRQRWERARRITARDRALLLLGFAGGFRRSELVAINVEHVRPHPKGIQILVPRSKTDQEGKGRWKAIPRYKHHVLDPVAAYEELRTTLEINAGPLFPTFDIHGQVLNKRLAAAEVSRIIKRACKRAGLRPEDFASHSLRSGFVTSAGERGVSPQDIAAVTHQSVATVMHYWKASQAFANPPLLRIFDNSEDP